MNYSKVKNGFKISVKKWSHEVVITDVATNKVVKTESFGDHIKAIMVAKAL